MMLKIKYKLRDFLDRFSFDNIVKNKIYKTTKVCDIINILNEFSEVLSSEDR